MKLTTRSRYGLKACAYLASKDTGEPISLTTMAQDLNLSENYLEQLLRTLRQNGVIKSVRGAQGGYMLAKPAEEITVGELLTILEGSALVTECALEDVGPCTEDCLTRDVFVIINRAIHEAVDKLTLKDIVEQKL